MEIWLLYANLSKSFAWINQHKLIVIIMEFHEEETEHVYITIYETNFKGSRGFSSACRSHLIFCNLWSALWDCL